MTRNPIGKINPEWKIGEEQRAAAAANAQALREAAEAGGVSQAREAHRLDRKVEFNKAVRKNAYAVFAAPVKLVYNVLNGALSGIFTAAKLTLGAAVAAGGVSGTIDHLEKENPENDPTLVRIVDFGIDNLTEFARHHRFDEAARALSRVVSEQFHRSHDGVDELPLPNRNDFNQEYSPGNILPQQRYDNGEGRGPATAPLFPYSDPDAAPNVAPEAIPDPDRWG